MMRHIYEVLVKQTTSAAGFYFAVLSVLLCIAVSAQAQQVLPDVDQFGPQVGEAVPDFLLPDQHGVIRDLNSILGQNGALIVFSRSVLW